MNGWVAQLISPEVAEKIGPNWGYGSGMPGDPGPWRGELRNMWKPMAQEGLATWRCRATIPSMSRCS